MTTAHVHKHEQHWWEFLDDSELEVDLRNLRGMNRIIQQGLLAERSDVRTARGNHRYSKHFYVSR